jgi:transcriptional regulator with XRE-family HTH domain
MLTSQTGAGPSTLHERLKAARDYSKRTQLDVAKEVGKSRATIALWESTNAAIRTRPNAEQVMAFARACGVPAELLVDDTTPVSAILLYRPGKARRGAQAVLPLATAESSARDGRGKLFWSTVQLQVTEAHPELRNAFDVLVERQGCSARVPFMHRRSAAWLLVLHGQDKAAFLAEHVPAVLFGEAVTGRKLTKHLLVLADADTPDADGVVIDDDALGCRLVTFTNWQTAADALASL